MYINVCTNTRKKALSTWACERAFPGPKLKMVDTVLEQNVDGIKIARVTPHLKDNLLQIHILIRNIPNW